MITTYVCDDDPRTHTFDHDTNELTIAPFYTDPECHSCQRVGRRLTEEQRAKGWMEYAFCGHIWDSVWKSNAAMVVASDHRVWIDGASFEGRPSLARDLAAALVAAAAAVDEFWPLPTTVVESVDS
ncbi:hypothetical protein [Gordonia sp. OPL2]|uniref:hypothetical protein n=1 Tax=Gordonia sp. OPL2 TaxID=2486274 RepID=UPI001654D7C1|nr:hypothetical protein [Gordonia sp. OPL2]ROZ89036.1 hypothetical protein EEB19_20230 [Gordonia sp. OPL2]